MLKRSVNALLSSGPQAQAAVIGVSSRVLAQVGGLFTLILSARSMSATDIGLYMIISTSALFGARLAESGWSELMCGRLDGDGPSADSAFWCALAWSLVPTSVGLIAGATILRYDWMAPSFDLALFILVSLIPVCAASAVQSGHLLAAGRVRAYAVTQFVAEGLGLTLTVVGLLMGYTLNALVAGRVFTVLATVILLPILTKWVPAVAFNRALWRSHLAFVLGPVGARMGGFFQGYGVDYIVFGFLGSAELATYRIANRIAGAVNELSQEPLRQHTWATLPLLLRDADPEGLANRVRALAVNTLGLMLPVYFVLILAASDFMPLLMPGQEWAGVAAVLILRTAAQVFGPFNAPAEVIVVTRASPSLTAGLAWVGAAISLSCALAASWAHPTAYTFALGQLIGTAICFAVNMYVLSRYHQMHWRRAWPDFIAWVFPITVVGLLCWLLRQKLPPLSQPLALAASAVPFLLLVLVIHWPRYKRLFKREGFFTLHLEKRRDTA